MSLVTRCTFCGTLFKVVADQLKISEGWVRCGQCATVFDAQANLVQISEQAPANKPASPSQPAAEPAIGEETKVEPVVADRPSDEHANDAKADIVQALDSDLPAQREGDIASDIQAFRDSKWQGSGMLGLYTGNQALVAAKNVETSTAPSASSAASSADALDESPLKPEQRQDGSNLSDEPSDAIKRSDDLTSASPVSVAPDAAPSETELVQPMERLGVTQDAVLAAPGFVVQAQRAQRWRSPWVRLGLGLLGLALLAVLALQIALHEKDRIAAQLPQAKPWLDQLCLAAGCKVEALRRIEAISVDASSFNRINKNNAQLEAITQSYRLVVTLKNAGAVPVALPHVELSLQDAQDQTVLRRVLSPADLGSSLNALAPSQEMPGNVTLQIDAAQLAGNRIAGYRVLAFYP